MTVVKLGGCNGSGKTTIARAVLELSNAKPEHDAKIGTKNPNWYLGEYDGHRVAVLGSYETVCGGMDTISDKDDRFNFVKKMAKGFDIVFFEGLITGKTYGALGELSEKHFDKDILWLYAFMDTPFNVCVKRVLKRRKERGALGAFDPERTMRPTFTSCERLRGKLLSAALPVNTEWMHCVHDVNHKEPALEEAKKLLDRAKGLIYAN